MPGIIPVQNVLKDARVKRWTWQGISTLVVTKPKYHVQHKFISILPNYQPTLQKHVYLSCQQVR